MQSDTVSEINDFSERAYHSEQVRQVHAEFADA